MTPRIGLSGSAGPLAPVAIGAALMVMVYMGGHVSGAHYNPAVSFGVFLRRKLTATDLALYWITQLVAAALAFTFGYVVSGHAGGIHPGAHVVLGSAIAAEIAFTAALVLVVLNVAVTPETQGNSFYGLAIGSTVAAGAFVGFGATFASAIFAGGSWSDLWLYLVAPLVGAALAAGIHKVQGKGLALATGPPEGEPSPGAPPPVSTG